MIAVYKKEVKGFLTSMVGYVFIAFLLVICGIYFTAYHLQGGYPYFAYTLEAVQFVFLIAVPVLTMRVLAEERKQKTDQLLLTSPVSVTEIVLGKFLALATIYLIPVLILCLYPLVLSQFGTIYYPETYTAMVGFFLLGCSFLAIGLYLSSVTESQVIAAVLTFLILFVCYVIEGIAGFFPETADGSFYIILVLLAVLAYLIYLMLGNVVIAVLVGVVAEAAAIVLYFVNASVYEGLIQKFLGILNLTGHYSEFSTGIFDLTGVVYYLIVIAVALFLTVQSIQKRRWSWSRFGFYNMTMTAMVVAGAVILNLIAAEIPSQYTQIDMSSQQLSVLGDQTKELAASLEKDITLYYIVQDATKDTYVSRLLERYDDLSDHITVVEKDPVMYPQFTSQYTEDSVTDNSVIAVCGEESRVISYENMYETEFNYNYYSYETTGFDAEGQITSAIAALNEADLPKVYTLTGHGELSMSSTMQQSVEKENIETEELNLVTSDKVPEDADCLLIISPANDLSEAEAEKILKYLRTGGKAVILTDYTGTDMPNFDSVLAYYGLERVDGAVMEGDSNYYVQIPYYVVPNINSTEVSSDLVNGGGYVLLAVAQGLKIAEDLRDGVQVTDVLTTSDSSYSKVNVETMTTYEMEEADIEGPFGLGVLVTETVELTDELLEETSDLAEENDSLGWTELGTVEESTADENSAENSTEDAAAAGITEDATETADSVEAAETVETKLAVFTSSALLDDSADSMVSGGNSRLFLNTLSWICGQTTSVSVPVKSLSADYLTVTLSAGNFWSIVTIAVIPGVFLIGGLYVWLRRRKR